MLDTGVEIRILRERLKMSAKELAEKIGLSQSQMSRLEKGQRRIDTRVLDKIARALQVDPSHFFRGQPVPASGVIPPTLPAAVGKLVRLERRQRHISAEELALKLGKPKSLIEAIEEGKRELEPELADRILKTLRLPTNYFLRVQQEMIHGLEAQIERLNEALAESNRGSLVLDAQGTAGTEARDLKRRGTPVLGSIAQGYPCHFDAAGRPTAEVTDFLYVPEFAQDGNFALHAVGDSMQGEGSPSFREGDLLIFSPGNLRSRDFAFVRIEGDEPTFRQVFFDPTGQIRLQPLNLNHPARTYPREKILALWRLVGHVARF